MWCVTDSQTDGRTDRIRSAGADVVLKPRVPGNTNLHVAGKPPL